MPYLVFGVVWTASGLARPGDWKTTGCVWLSVTGVGFEFEGGLPSGTGWMIVVGCGPTFCGAVA